MTKIKQKLKSSLLSEAAYNDETMELTLTLNNGGEYVYQGVSKERFEEMLASESAGKFYLKSIKGKYETIKHEKEKE